MAHTYNQLETPPTTKSTTTPHTIAQVSLSPLLTNLTNLSSSSNTKTLNKTPSNSNSNNLDKPKWQQIAHMDIWWEVLLDPASKVKDRDMEEET
jgi:hypothetical protein